MTTRLTRLSRWARRRRNPLPVLGPLLGRVREQLQSRDERGTSAVTMVLVTPALITVLVFVAGLARLANADQQVHAVAADAARAASLQRSTAQSEAAARAAARASLGQAGLSCQSLGVQVNVSAYRPGGSVVVRVACTAQLGDVAMAGFPGQRTFRATSIVPIETWRADS